MNIVVKFIVTILIGIITNNIEAQNIYSITVNVEDANTNEGKMFLAVYNSENEFLEKPFQVAKSEITNNTCVVSFENIPEGIYAVSIFHDENNNGKMDTNFVGIPKEDYGCSNNAWGFMGPPKWEDAKFELKKNKTITITL